jgi:hypothetical protein
MPTILRGSDNFDTAGGNAVKAWVNFNGQGGSTIGASFNVSSVTRNGSGQYTTNFATALPDANYAVSSSMGFPSSSGRAGSLVHQSLTTTSHQYITQVTASTSATTIEFSVTTVQYFR